MSSGLSRSRSTKTFPGRESPAPATCTKVRLAAGWPLSTSSSPTTLSRPMVVVSKADPSRMTSTTEIQALLGK